MALICDGSYLFPDMVTASTLATDTAVIIGQGNVAVDCARILCKDPDELAYTDIAAHALDILRMSQIKNVIMVGRRGHVQVMRCDMTSFLRSMCANLLVCMC